MGRRISYGADPIQQQRLTDQEQNAAAAQDLHEREFGEKQGVDLHRMSLDDLEASLNQAKTLSALVAARTKLENDYRTTITGAALAERLSRLDPTSNTYQRDAAAAIAKYSQGADTDAAKAVIKMQQENYQNHVVAQRQNQNEAYKAGIVKRVEKISENDNVPPAMKSALILPDGSVSTAALDAAEQVAQKGGNPTSAKDFASAAENFNKLIEQEGGRDTAPRPYIEAAAALTRAATHAAGGTSSLDNMDIANPAVPGAADIVPSSATPVQTPAPAPVATPAPTPAPVTAPAPTPAPVAAPTPVPAQQSVATQGAVGNTDAVAALINQFRQTGGQPAATPAPDQTGG